MRWNDFRPVTSVTHALDAGREPDAATLPRAAFYCVSSGLFFLGAVAMVNSLRLLGHSEPIFVLDCGLSAAQRDFLSAEATVVAAPKSTTPFLLKTVAPLRHPAEVMVLIDADIIVTRSLEHLIHHARQGRIVAVEHGQDRYFPEWGDLIGRTARHRRYVSSSLVLLGGPVGSNVIQNMDRVQRRIDLERTPYSGSVPDFASLGGSFPDTDPRHPFYFADQDVLNAILATQVDAEQVEVLDRRAEAITPFTGLRLIDEKTLRCTFEDGTEPFAVHHFMPTKPWLEPTIPGVYSRLLTRLLYGPDVALHVPHSELPDHLTPGLVGAARSWRRGGLSARFRALRARMGAGSRKPGD
jgi:hypothetical protein